MLKRTIILAVVMLAAAALPTFAQQTTPNTADAGRNKYQNAEVAAFTAQEGVQAPAELLQSLSTSAVQELQKLKKFQQVTAEGAAAATTTATATTSEPAAANGPTVRVVGVVTKYKAGSRAKRYLVGFGAGKTKVDVLVRFVDKTTGEVLHEQNVDGDVVMGLFGGDSGGATREVGKEVAKAAKKRFF